MDHGIWKDVCGADNHLGKILKEAFPSGASLLQAFDGADDAAALVDQAYKGTKDVQSCKRLGVLLEGIQRKFARVDKSSITALVRNVREGPTVYRGPKTVPRDVYDSLVSNSTAIGLEIIEKSLRLRRNATRADKELAEKEKWALLLAEMIRDAKKHAARDSFCIGNLSPQKSTLMSGSFCAHFALIFGFPGKRGRALIFIVKHRENQRAAPFPGKSKINAESRGV